MGTRQQVLELLRSGDSTEAAARMQAATAKER